jgi:hypothetical protein
MHPAFCPECAEITCDDECANRAARMSQVTINDLRDVVTRDDRDKPRSRQRTIGPSDAGTPCSRRLAYKMIGAEPVNTDSDPWAAIVGTAVHAHLEQVFTRENKRLERVRYATEVRVELPGYMRGTCDLVDIDARTVIDHKVVGVTALRRVKGGDVGDAYRTQVHLYAAGLRLAGYDIDTVAIAFWSRSGAMRDSLLWHEPYDAERVEVALRRIDALRTVTALGATVLPTVPTADSFCLYCPFYLPASTQIETGCPGHVDTGITPHLTEQGEQ